MTVRDALEMSSQDDIIFDLFDCDTEDCHRNIEMPINGIYDDEIEEILDCELVSWDIENGIICFNYTSEDIPWA